MNKRKIKQTVSELTDALYEYQGFCGWWDTLSTDEEDSIEKILEDIVERRVNKDKPNIKKH